MGNLLLFFFLSPPCVACGILVHCPGIEPSPPAVEARSLNHWTTREVQKSLIYYFFLNRNPFFKKFIYFIFIYLFIFLILAVLGLRFCARAFSSCGEWGPLFIAVRGPLTIAASLVAEHRLQTRYFWLRWVFVAVRGLLLAVTSLAAEHGL